MKMNKIGSLRTAELDARRIAPVDIKAPTRSGFVVYRVASAMVGVLFLVSGYGKIGGFESVAGWMAGTGLPIPHVLLALALTLEIVAGALLILGVKVRWAALALAAFLVPTTTIFHAFWAADAAQYQEQLTAFLKNLAILGATLVLASYAGHFTKRRPKLLP